MIKVVLDTNILLVAISPRSKDHWIFENFISESYILCVTTDILIEYEEIIGREMGQNAAIYLMQILENAQNVMHVTSWFKWDLILNDPDDNKFVDCAVASQAAFIVTEDRHFNVLKKIPFPKVQVLNTTNFKKELKKIQPNG
jgi:putative PIN family toxin of toxin-antitoxin system